MNSLKCQKDETMHLNIFLFRNILTTMWDEGFVDIKGVNGNQLQASVSRERAAVYCCSLLRTGYVMPSSNRLKAKGVRA